MMMGIFPKRVIVVSTFERKTKRNWERIVTKRGKAKRVTTRTVKVEKRKKVV